MPYITVLIIVKINNNIDHNNIIYKNYIYIIYMIYGYEDEINKKKE